MLIGNALADRMQHDGWLETYLQSELSGSDLVFRNQGFSGDRIDRRPRSVGFPSEDAYLELSSTNVLFVMFGYNESFYDDAPGYGQALTSWIDSTQAKTYSGDGPPRIVLFSPIAFENLNDPNLPDGSEHNRRLEAYTEVTKSVAEAKGVDFVDLFHPSLAAYQSSEEALTINGVHLNREGNRVVGRIAAEAILGWTPKEDEAKLETIRQAVVDKNWHWFNSTVLPMATMCGAAARCSLSRTDRRTTMC